MSAQVESNILPRLPQAAARNRKAICEVLKDIFPARGLVLEIGSGSGAHAAYFAEQLPHLTFQPSDRRPECKQEIADWIVASGVDNIRPPETFDVHEDECPIDGAEALLAVNVLHIAPWHVSLDLLALASNILPFGGPLVLYGPFHRSDVATVQSNLDFDGQLRRDNPAYGLRHLDDITTHAHDLGLAGPQVIQMPANNLCVVFTKA